MKFIFLYIRELFNSLFLPSHDPRFFQSKNEKYGKDKTKLQKLEVYTSNEN